MSKDIVQSLYLRQRQAKLKVISEFGKGIAEMAMSQGFLGGNWEIFEQTVMDFLKDAREYNDLYAETMFIPEDPTLKSLTEHSAARSNTSWNLEAIGNLEN